MRREGFMEAIGYYICWIRLTCFTDPFPLRWPMRERNDYAVLLTHPKQGGGYSASIMNSIRPNKDDVFSLMTVVIHTHSHHPLNYTITSTFRKMIELKSLSLSSSKAGPDTLSVIVIQLRP